MKERISKFLPLISNLSAGGAILFFGLSFGLSVFSSNAQYLQISNISFYCGIASVVISFLSEVVEALFF
jgi:hypothetical protein